MEIKTEINKWDLVKLKRVDTAKETINKKERQPTDWEKIFANEATDEALISKIYKHLIQLNNQKTKWPNHKMGRRPTKTFLRDIQMAKQAHEKILNISNY